MFRLHFVVQLITCFACVTLVRLFVLPTIVLVPLLRSRFDFIAIEVLYCVAEHGTRSSLVAEQVLSRAIGGAREVEREAMRAVPLIGPALSGKSEILQRTLLRLTKRPEKHIVVRELMKAFDTVGKRGVPMVPTLLALAASQPAAIASEVRRAACLLLSRHEPSTLAIDVLEQLLLRVSRGLLRDDAAWEQRWTVALEQIAEHLAALSRRRRFPRESLTRLENELGLLLFQHPKAVASEGISRVIQALRGQSGGES